MKRLILSGATLLALVSHAGIAQAEEITPGRELAELVYGSMEDPTEGGIDMGQFVAFGRSIFESMDTNEGGSVDLQEFRNWDFGFNFIAEDEGQVHAYQAAQQIVFAVWDADGDGEIDRHEYHNSMHWDFRRADLDRDAFLTQEEFLQGYIVNKAYRAAIVGF
jgi:hypothetical protein